MSYFKRYSSMLTDKEQDIVNFLKSLVVIEPGSMQLQDNNNRKMLTDKEIRAYKILFTVLFKMVVGKLIMVFCNARLDKFSVYTMMTKNKHNKALIEYLDNTANTIIEKRGYKSCSGKQFKNSSFFELLKADYRGSLKKSTKFLSYRVIELALRELIVKGVQFPGAGILTVPLKTMLGYVGINLGTGGVHDIFVDINGNTFMVGITFTKLGFILRPIFLYCFNEKGKLITVQLKEPPEYLYEITKEDIKEAVDKFGLDTDLTSLKKEVSRDK